MRAHYLAVASATCSMGVIGLVTVDAVKHRRTRRMCVYLRRGVKSDPLARGRSSRVSESCINNRLHVQRSCRYGKERNTAQQLRDSSSFFLRRKGEVIDNKYKNRSDSLCSATDLETVRNDQRAIAGPTRVLHLRHALINWPEHRRCTRCGFRRVKNWNGL